MANEIKNNILLFIKTPPPTTGATLISQLVFKSKLLRSNFIIKNICATYNNKMTEVGKWNFKKCFVVIKTVIILIYELLLHRPDLVYFHLSPVGIAFYRDLLYVTIIKMFKVKVVFHIHARGISSTSKFQKIFYKFCFKNEYLICLSKNLIYDINYVFNGKIFIVPNGIPDFNEYTYEKHNNKVAKILFLSNLIEDKGLKDYIYSLNILKKNGFAFEGIIVGAEADISSYQLNEIIEKFGLNENIKYLGPKYGEKKDKIMFSSDIFVFPTRIDTFPIVLLEAMKFGLPVISTDEGAIPEVVDDFITGYIVPKNNPKAIAEKLEILIKNPDLRKKMGEAGRKKFEEKFAINIFENNILKVFKEI